MAKRITLEEALERTLKKRISSAYKSLAKTRKDSDSEYIVFQLSEATIRSQLLNKENRDLAPLVAESYKKYLSSLTTTVGTKGQLTKLVENGYKKPILYSSSGSLDIILVVKDLRTLTNILDRSNAYVSRELNISELQLRGPTKGYDLGQVGRSSKQHTSTAHLVNLQKRLANKPEARKLLNTVTNTINSLNAAELASSEYAASFKATTQAGRLSGELGFSYIIPQSGEFREAVLAAEDKAVKELMGGILDIYAGSKTINDQITEDIKSSLWGNKYSYKGKVSDSGSLFGKPADKTKKKRAKVSKAKQKRLTNQKPKSRTGTTALGLKELINAKLAKAVEENMGRPNLIYRTGRFAESVQVTRITEGRDAALNIYYNYMKRPYETFEPHGALGHLGYNPVPLMDKSIRDVAMELTRQKFRSIRE